MTRSRSRHARSTEGEAAAVLPAKKDEGWERPWVPWAIGGGLLLAGTLVGWVLPALVLRPIAGAPAAVAKKPAKVGPPAAAVLGPALQTTAAPGEQIELRWEIQNVGQADWPVDAYRFVPVAGEGLSVLPLPATTKSGDRTTVHALVTVPTQPGTWAPAWEMRGAAGPVAGGTITATVQVNP